MHCSHPLRGEKHSRPHRIARIFSTTKDGALRLLGSLGSYSRIVWFSSPISRLGWEVFHRTNQVRLLTIITGLTLSALGFPPQLSLWVRRFFIDRSLLYRPHRPPGARSMILRNLVFPPHIPIYRQEVFSTVSHVGYTTSIATRSSELAPKKEGNCNAVATRVT